jgi:hypothetical protein
MLAKYLANRFSLPDPKRIIEHISGLDRLGTCFQHKNIRPAEKQEIYRNDLQTKAFGKANWHQ